MKAAYLYNTRFWVVAAVFLAAVSAGFLSAPTPVEQPLPAYAPVKKYSLWQPPKKFECNFPVPCPKRGVLMSEGSIISPSANWVLIDLDTQTINTVTTDMQPLNDATFKLDITSSATRKLTNAQMNETIVLANNVWNPPPVPKNDNFYMPSDVVCSIYVLDGELTKEALCYSHPSKGLYGLIRKISIFERPVQKPPQIKMPPPSPIAPVKTGN